MVILTRLVLTALLLAALPAAAQGPANDKGKPYPIVVSVGGAKSICTTGTIMCPATVPICDDTSIATMRDGKDGMEIVGVKPGQTLCSAMSQNQARQVYAVTVR